MNILFTVVGFLLAFVVRFWDISALPSGLHWDEQDTGYQAYSLLKTGKDYFGNPLPLFLHSMADYRTPVFIYSAVPSVAAFGLTPLSVRLPALTWNLLSVFLLYILSRYLFPKTHNPSLIIFIIALSPWSWIYARTSVECNAMLPMLLLGLIGFITRRYKTSALGFALAIASYSPAKFFVPLFLLTLIITYRKQILIEPAKRFILPVLILGLISGPIIYDGFFGLSSTRFKDISILNDPMLSQDVNYDRFLSTVSANPSAIGVAPSVISRISFNKLQRIWWQFSQNYLRVFSPEYLFIKGDLETRHSPGRDTIGQLHLIEVVPFVLGIAYLITYKRSPFFIILFSWLLIGAIPSSLTRGGGPHAARTYLMLPAFLLVIFIGINILYRHSKILVSLYLAFYILSSIYIYNYLFTTYRSESLKSFQWGYDKAAAYALSHSSQVDRVILDTKQDSPLMSFLFTSQFDPTAFQNTYPLPTTKITNDISGVTLENIVLLHPGVRNWTDVFPQDWFAPNQLLIVEASQPLLTRMTPTDIISYPDGSPAFYIFKKLPPPR